MDNGATTTTVATTEAAAIASAVAIIASGAGMLDTMATAVGMMCSDGDGSNGGSSYGSRGGSAYPSDRRLR